MIKNQKQAAVTREKLAEMKEAMEKLLLQKEELEPKRFQFAENALQSVIKEMELELEVYEGLVNNNLHVWKPRSLENISDSLIAARLAQKMSQRELGEKVGIKEQQIQRYEQTDYETASWPRIVEISMALNLKFYFEKVVIINNNKNNGFEIPTGVSSEKIQSLTLQCRNQHSLIL